MQTTSAAIPVLVLTYTLTVLSEPPVEASGWEKADRHKGQPFSYENKRVPYAMCLFHARRNTGVPLPMHPITCKTGGEGGNQLSLRVRAWHSYFLGRVAGRFYPLQMNDVPDVLLYGEHLVQLQVKSVVRPDLLSQQQQHEQHQEKHETRQANQELWSGRLYRISTDSSLHDHVASATVE